MEVSLIAALTRGSRIIGSASGGLPWNLPKDKHHFRSSTAHKPILLGRKTFEEMRGWFTTQSPIFVLTRSPNFLPHTPATPVASFSDALTLANSQNLTDLVVAGGAATFHAALPFATRLILTWVDADLTGLPSPLHFPDFDPDQWPLRTSESWPADPDNPYPMTLEIRTR